ncbi:MAG: DUF4331 family protein [Candidatus Eremiobacteraeota bacterium]|nr:DUF4331 family protein [Candidatus Eremiobacteraeota bacterium]MBV9972971.1 DUF4331 family protein [Candidatus Eremiobacteraeota bacterium]
MKYNLIISTAALLVFALAGCSNNSTSLPRSGNKGSTFSQLDRLNRPAINEVLATFARHDTNNRDNPSDDAANLKNDITNFMTNVAGRSPQVTAGLEAVLIPDVQIVDLSGTSQSCLGTAPGTCNNYLGVETAGSGFPTQKPAGLKPFGGRALTDDIVTIDLSAIFGSVIPLALHVPDDGKEQDGRADPAFPGGPCVVGNCTGGVYPPGHRPVLTTDNVTYLTAPKHFQTVFPYIGAPQ